jgi:hypothetical protein
LWIWSPITSLKKEAREEEWALVAQEKLLNASCPFKIFLKTSIEGSFVLFINISRLVWVMLKRKRLRKKIRRERIGVRCMVGSIEIWLGIGVWLWMIGRFWRIEMIIVGEFVSYVKKWIIEGMWSVPLQHTPNVHPERNMYWH